MPGNIAGLIKNIELNEVEGKIIPFCAPLSNEFEVGNFIFTLQSMETGGKWAKLKIKEDAYMKPIDPVVTLTSPGYSLDDLVDMLGLLIPDHIKIDGDGVEPNNSDYAGAMKTYQIQK